MAAWLNGWLKDIVLILLLATFVDLLIPNHSLQRYVKVVVSLIVLLTILSPVLSLLHVDIDVQQPSRLVEQTVRSANNLPALASIIEEGGRLRQAAENRSAELVSAQLIEMIGERVTALYPEVAAEVKVAVIADSSMDGEARIDRVRIKLTPHDQEEVSRTDAHSRSSTTTVIEPVYIEAIEQVNIARVAGSSGSGRNEHPTQPAQADNHLSELTRERLAAERLIRQSLWDWLRVEGRQVEISWAD